MSFPFLTTTEEITRFCQEALKQPAVGVDTEFVWTSTYYPMLGLIQIAWDKEHCALIDPLAAVDPAPVRELLETPGVRKVFHEAASDLPILHRWCKAIPCNIADTRIAAGFCGLTARLSLAKLLALQLRVVLPKTETRTDWTQRPLTPAQLAYAGDDVTLLPALFSNLLELIQNCGNETPFFEEMKIYENASYYEEPDPLDAWKRCTRPAYLHFTRQDFAVLQALAAWRENLAKQKNITRSRIIRDDFLTVAAVKHPYTQEEVAKLPGIWPTSVKHYGAEMAECVTKAMKLTSDQWPELFHAEMDQRLLKQRSDRVLSLIAKRAEVRKIDPMLVATRREAESLVVAASLRRAPEKHPLMNGWKHELLAPAIDEIASEYVRKSK